MGTEQILLGLIGESTGIAAKVLKSMGVNLKVRRCSQLAVYCACPYMTLFGMLLAYQQCLISKSSPRRSRCCVVMSCAIYPVPVRLPC